MARYSAELERWPQYRGRLLVDGAGRTHVRLATFQYFLSWFAFYVLRSGQAAAEPARARGGRYLAPSLGVVKKVRGQVRVRGKVGVVPCVLST